MARIVIGGLVNCPIFAHVDHIAHLMADTFPDFHVKKFMLKEQEYENWLCEVNDKNGWHHRTSPIVWKEPSMEGGAARLVGGAGDFWEYCHEYYGVLSDLTRHDTARLALDNLEKLSIATDKEKELRRKYKARRVCISGAGHPMARLLVSDLLRIPGLPKQDGIVIFLYDVIEMRQKLARLKDDTANMGSQAGLGACIVVDSLELGLHRCDLLIVLNDYPREPDEPLRQWLERNYAGMVEIAEALEAYAPKRCRVVLATPGDAPLCFNASVLIDAAHKMTQDNIVAVTADLGLEALPTLARATGVSLPYLGAPPVWGFVGINKFVDLHGTLQTAVVYRPNGKSVKRPVRDSTLPLGRYRLEPRKLGYLLKDVPDLWSRVRHHRDEAERLLGRSTLHAKVRATTDMLRFWYSNDYKGEVISLGICSNGTFQIPWGMNFSQPAYLEDDHWTPCKQYPLPFDPYCDLRYLIPLAGEILKNFGVGVSFNADWVLTKEARLAKMQAVMTAKQVSLFEDRKEIEEILRVEHERELDQESRKQTYMARLAAEVERCEGHLVAEHAVESLVRGVFDLCLPYPPPPVKEPPKKRAETTLSFAIEEEEAGEEEEEEEDEEDEDDD